MASSFHMRSLPAVLVMAALAAPLLPGRSAACTCVRSSNLSLVGRADVIFLGTAVRRFDAAEGDTIRSSADPVTYTFIVQRVFKGEPADEFQVTTARDGASCGFSFRLDEGFLVFADERDGELRTGSCTGTAERSRAKPMIAFLDSLDLPTLPHRFNRELTARLIREADAATDAERPRRIVKVSVAHDAVLAAPALIGWYKTGNERQRLASVRTMSYFRGSGHRLRRVLVEALQDSSALIRKEAAMALKSLATDFSGTSPLLAALEHPDPEVRRIAASGLDPSLPFEHRALPALVAALGDDDPGVRTAAVKSVSEAPWARAYYDTVADRLEDPDPDVRTAVLEALWKMAPDRAAPVILDGLSDPDSTLRVRCLRLAVTCGLGDENEVSARAVRDPSPLVRREGWRLGRLADETAVDLVPRGLSDPDFGVQWEVLSFLGNRRREAIDSVYRTPQVLLALTEASRDPMVSVRTGVVSVIARTGLADDLHDVLVRLARDPEPRVRTVAVRALCLAPLTEQVEAALTRALDDPEPDVQEAARRSLNCRH